MKSCMGDEMSGTSPVQLTSGTLTFVVWQSSCVTVQRLHQVLRQWLHKPIGLTNVGQTTCPPDPVVSVSHPHFGYLVSRSYLLALRSVRRVFRAPWRFEAVRPLPLRGVRHHCCRRQTWFRRLSECKTATMDGPCPVPRRPTRQTSLQTQLPGGLAQSWSRSSETLRHTDGTSAGRGRSICPLRPDLRQDNYWINNNITLHNTISLAAWQLRQNQWSKSFHIAFNSSCFNPRAGYFSGFWTLRNEPTTPRQKASF